MIRCCTVLPGRETLLGTVCKMHGRHGGSWECKEIMCLRFCICGCGLGKLKRLGKCEEFDGIGKLFEAPCACGPLVRTSCVGLRLLRGAALTSLRSWMRRARD